MSRLTLGISCTALVASLGACDRQVDAEFQGESLMRIRASVVIPVGLEGADLVPAIAFAAASPMRGRSECWRSDHQRFVEVGVSGDFPSNFTLDVFDPPPPEAMRRLERGPAFAIGSVAALPREHPEAIMVYPFDDEILQEWTDVTRDACYVEVEEGDYINDVEGGVCSVVHACTLDGDRCLYRELDCQPGNPITDRNDCEIVDSSGDETLAVAGYSVNYTVMYFEGPVEAGTRLSRIYGAGKPISAGYHLYHVESPNQPPNDCFQHALETGVARYNEANGTDWQWYELLGMGPTVEHTLEETDEFVCEYLQVLDETDCMSIETNVKEVGAEAISIELGSLSSTSYR